MSLRRWSGALLLLLTSLAAGAQTPMTPCRIEGMPNELQCGVMKRPLDPARPQGVQIELHYAVVPAMARNKQPDPVLLLAGGPGQSAISLAPAVLSRLSRLNNRRDLVFIDQRGTGRSAPLQCADDVDLTLAEAADDKVQARRLAQCRQDLALLPYGGDEGLRFFTTTIAMQDFEAVREALGAPQWNLVGASYGTRAALEYQRQYPGRVRRTVLDGVAPPDMVLPASFSVDGQAALDALFAACETDAAGCAKQYPALRERWQQLLHGLPRKVSALSPRTGLPETFVLTPELLLRAVRAPLYAPALAAALPAAIDAAASGRYEGLLGLGVALGGGGKRDSSSRLAMGMHFSVICAEDLPRLQGTEAAGADFARVDAHMYEQACKTWPRGVVPPAFYTVPPAQSPVLVLSGGVDPAT
ncbi:alpha/beta hydrolase, partial [Pelomonas sp. KK5]|uniref:alpha/beta hydrolase n=1 Tax=Pelomonas sp. KK5 TaxID=1855730 RepID=UPI00117C49D8